MPKTKVKVAQDNEALANLRAKLTAAEGEIARLRELLRWHQVAGGQGDLPPEGETVIWVPNDPTNKPSKNVARLSVPVACTTYRWRYYFLDSV
jgi:hypothetical protein